VSLAADIEQRLREAGDPARAVAERAYLKSSMEFAGVGLPGLRGIVRALLPRRRALARDSLLAVVTELWARPLFECRLAASMLLGDHAEALIPADAALVERLIREAGTWALVDELASVVMGGMAGRYPELTAVLDQWATDEDFWVRRAALLSLLRPLRRGEGDFDRFARYADIMLAEREFFIRGDILGSRLRTKRMFRQRIAAMTRVLAGSSQRFVPLRVLAPAPRAPRSPL
jgi:3-methyladenine DNA glycosylase AlkD